MKIVALVPMKGHSERVPNKNLKIFNGKPLYHVIVNTLQKSKYISDIVINTDSDNITVDIKKNFPKIRINQRPKEICGDFVPMNEVIAYDLNKTEADLFIQTHSTNPLLKTETLDKAIEYLLSNNKIYDSMFSVTKHQTRLWDKLFKPFNHNPKELLRTQDLDPLYEENSCFFIFSKDSFFSNDRQRIGKKPYLYEMSKIEAVDIDTKEDFILAEEIFKSFNKLE